MRPEPVLHLLQSVQGQTVFPDEVLIIDGSLNDETQFILEKNTFSNLKYFKVPPQERGLTKQRNFGIKKVHITSEIVCFLDDDTVLLPNYFEEILKTYHQYPEALAVSGYMINDSNWDFVGENYQPPIHEFYYDGWKRKDSSRFILRKKLGLDTNCPPGYISMYSHGRSLGFLPPSNKTYEAEMLVGCVFSFKKKIFETLHFSTYFEGYGLYEDADFCLRLAKIGKLYVNTAAQLNHYHDASGRPNQYKYGQMVVRNGWYVWRVKNPNPSLKDRFKWNLITLLLTFIRFTNIITTTQKKEAFTEALGRTTAWFSLLLIKPK